MAEAGCPQRRKTHLISYFHSALFNHTMSKLIPKDPTEFNGSHVLQRMVDAILIRYTIATKDISDIAINYRATPESMSMLELQKHILLLILWVSKSLDLEIESKDKAETFQDFEVQIKERIANLSQHIVTLSDEQLSKKTIFLKRADTHYSIWYMIHGPLADAIHHIGQIITWRRICGNPIGKISPFTGESY